MTTEPRIDQIRDHLLAETPTVKQVEGVFAFLEGYMWGVAANCGTECDMCPPLDERLLYARQWLLDHQDEIIDYMLDSDCAVDDGA